MNSKFLVSTLVVVLGAVRFALGDVVQCENGDRYTGKVLLVNETDVKLLNDIQGQITIPRSKVLSIQFREAASRPTAAGTSPKTAETTAQGGLKVDPAVVSQVQQEILGTANPEANQLFQEMVQGLASGTLNLGDIRNQAQSTLEEVRKLQKELGDDDTAGLLNSYVGILESFVNNATNTPPPKRSEPIVPKKQGP